MVRAGLAAFDRAGVFRVVLVNGGLVLSLLPTPSGVKVAASVLVLAGLAWFLPLVALALRASARARTSVGPSRAQSGVLAPQNREGTWLAR